MILVKDNEEKDIQSVKVIQRLKAAGWTEAGEEKAEKKKSKKAD